MSFSVSSSRRQSEYRFGIRVLLERIGRLPLVDVAKRDDVHQPGGSQVGSVVAAAAAGADDGDSEAIAWAGPVARVSQPMPFWSGRRPAQPHRREMRDG